MVKSFEDIGAVRAFDDIESQRIGDVSLVKSFNDIEPENEVGFLGAAIERPEEKLPFLGPLHSLNNVVDVMQASKRLQQDDYKQISRLWGGMDKEETFAIESIAGMYGFPTPISKEKDIATVEEYLKDRGKKYTLGGRVGQILSNMPAFMLEYLATGGLAKIGDKAARKAGTKILNRYAKTTAGKAAIGTGAFGTSAAFRAAGMPVRAINSIAQRQAPQHINIKDSGEVEIIGPVEGFATSIYKGLMDHYVEVASEQSGEFFGPALAKTKNLPFMGTFLNRLGKTWMGKTGKTLKQFQGALASKTGFHGVLSEVGEEYLGDMTRAILNINDFGVGKDASMLSRLGAAVKADTKNLDAMLVAFSVPSAGFAVAARQNYKALEKDKQFQDALSDLQIEETRKIAQTEQDKLWYGDSYSEDETYTKDFKKPDLLVKSGMTPKWLVNRILGVEPLVQDVDAAKMAMILEQQQIGSWTAKIVKKIKKLKSLERIPDLLPSQQLEERIDAEKQIARDELNNLYFGFDIETEGQTTKEYATELKNKITENKPLYIMRDLLDTYEESPKFLNQEEAEVFNQIRELTRYLRVRTNIVREKMGLKPIGDVKGYITHWLDKTAEQIVNNDLPVHSGYLYNLMRELPKTRENKTALKRKVKNQMEKDFSKDLGKLLRLMTSYDLWDIHLLHPYTAAYEELQQLRKDKIIPQSTYEEIEKYLRFDIRNEKTALDKAFDITVKKPTDLLNKILPKSKQISDPSHAYWGTLRKMGMLSGLGFRIKPAMRNLGQRMLLLDLYRTKDYAKAQATVLGLRKMPKIIHPIRNVPVSIMDYIKEQDWYQVSLNKFEDTSEAMGLITRSALKLYGATHVGKQFLSNVEVSAMTGYYEWLNNYELSNNKNSQHYKEAVIMAHKQNIPLENLLTHEMDMMWHIREAVRRTQWEYMSMSMPSAYRGQFSRAMLQFQSWWMNYFFNHSRECINQTLTGRNSLGRKLPPNGRLRALKGIGTIQAIGRATEQILGIEMLKYLFVPVPGYLPPIPSLIIGILQYYAADDDKKKKVAARKIKQSLKFWVPFSAFWRDLNGALSGEINIGDFLFYKKKTRE